MSLGMIPEDEVNKGKYISIRPGSTNILLTDDDNACTPSLPHDKIKCDSDYMQMLIKDTIDLLPDTQSGCYSPCWSKVNFISPSLSFLQRPDILYPNNLNPGIFDNIINDNVAHVDPKLCKSHKVIVDLQKINPKTTDTLGQINLFGHEDTLTFVERQRRLVEEQNIVKELPN